MNFQDNISTLAKTTERWKVRKYLQSVDSRHLHLAGSSTRNFKIKTEKMLRILSARNERKSAQPLILFQFLRDENSCSSGCLNPTKSNDSRRRDYAISRVTKDHFVTSNAVRMKQFLGRAREDRRENARRGFICGSVMDTYRRWRYPPAATRLHSGDGFRVMITCDK